MVLGRELSRIASGNPRYKAFFVDYDKLKKLADAGEVAGLMALLQKELNQVNDIAEVEWESLESQLKTWLNKGGVSEVGSLENLRKALLQLHEFSEINYMCFRKIMNRCGERQSTSSCTWFMDRINSSPFRNRNWDIGLAQLGQLYAMWREKSKGTPTVRPPFPIGQSSPEAFLVPVSKIMAVKVALLKKLRPATKQVRIHTTSNTRNANEVTYDFKSASCHVYFDSSRGDQYQERYKRMVEGKKHLARGALLQCRLPTGDGHADPNAEVHIDVEDSQCVGAECVLPQKAMASLTKGVWNPLFQQGKDVNPKALDSALTEIKHDQLRPCLSVHFSRSSFGADDGEVLVTLDEDVNFRDEAVPDAKAWCLSASKGGSTERQVPFVGGLLRVWYPPGAEPRSFVPSFYGIDADDLRVVPGFSEALHGMALIHREVASPLPPWIPPEALPAPTFSSTLLQPVAEERSVAQPATTPESKVTEAARQAPSFPSTAIEGVRTRCWEGCLGTYAPERELLVDCKVPLSIERTLLRWLRSTVILGSLSAFLISQSSLGTQINGVLLGLVSLIFVIMPLKSFIRGSLQLMNPQSKQPKVDRVMPWVMASSLVIVLAATLVVDISGIGLPGGGAPP